MEGPIQSVLSHLEKVKPSGDGRWMACCPAHADKSPSMQVTRGEGGKALLKCFGGCSLEDIVSAMGMEMTDLFAEDTSAVKREIVAEYDYLDEDGDLLFQVVRFMPKDFRQRKPDGNGGWNWKLGDTRRVLYRLPELLENAERMVFLVEGEKDVHSLEAIGLLATTNPGGAGKWSEEYTQTLAGRHVVILADVDMSNPEKGNPGWKHAYAVAQQLNGHAASLKLIELRGLAPKGDVSDWLEGNNADELRSIVRDAPVFETTQESIYKPKNPREPSLVGDMQEWEDWFTRVDKIQCGEIQPSIECGLPDVDRAIGFFKGEMVVIAADTSVGKSAFALQVSYGMAKHSGASVLYVSLEMSKRQMRGRLMCHEAQIEKNKFDERAALSSDEWARMEAAAASMRGIKMYLDDRSGQSLDDVMSTVARYQPMDVVVVDYLNLVDAGIGDRASQEEKTTHISRSLRILASESDACVVALAQFNREGAKLARPTIHHLRGSGAIEQDADVVAIIDRKDREKPDCRVYVDKRRDRGVGSFDVWFDGKMQTFTDSSQTFDNSNWGGSI